MAYPSFDWLLTSDTDGDGGVVLDRAQDGTTRGRSLFPSTKRSFNGRHLIESAVDLATLFAHYETTKAASFSITWTGPDPASYTVFYRARPKAVGLGNGRFDVTVSLVEA